MYYDPAERSFYPEEYTILPLCDRCPPSLCDRHLTNNCGWSSAVSRTAVVGPPSSAISSVRLGRSEQSDRATPVGSQLVCDVKRGLRFSQLLDLFYVLFSLLPTFGRTSDDRELKLGPP